MKKLIAFLFLTVVLVGCRSSYDVTLTNGSMFTGVSKPKLDREKGMYTFKNAAGRNFEVPETRVRTVEPHVGAKEKQFRNQNDFKSSGR